MERFLSFLSNKTHAKLLGRTFEALLKITKIFESPA